MTKTAKPQAAKPAKGPQAPKEAKPPEARPENPRATKGGNKIELSPDEQRASFLRINQQIVGLRAKADAANKLVKDALADAKASGFLKKDFDIARDLADKDNKIKDEVTRRLRIAQWLGHPIGAQLDMFAEPDRTPIVDRAYDDGKMASMEGKPRKPPHAAETDAARAWFGGFDDHQRELQGGFKTLTPKEGEVENKIARMGPQTSSLKLVSQGVEEDEND